jgi:glycosyltransferase involved in cell wall biosynthesis
MVPAISYGWLLSHLSFYFGAGLLFSFTKLLLGGRFDHVLGIGALTPYADVATVHFVQAREIALQRQGVFPAPHPLAGIANVDYTLYSRVMSWMGARFYRRSRASIVAISESVKRDLVEFEGANPDLISVVPNGVDIDRFCAANRERYRTVTRKELMLTDEEVAVLFVGNSWGRKGLRSAIEAISGSDQADVRLVVVGEGEQRGFVSGLAPDVAKRIIFVGSEFSQVERYYAAADVFMFPTVYEPFGLVILEALSSGLPSIFSACAGASEWLEDGVDAIFLHNPVDGQEARSALNSITSDPEFAATLSLNGRQAAETLQWSNVVTGLLAASMSQKLTAATKV